MLTPESINALCELQQSVIQVEMLVDLERGYLALIDDYLYTKGEKRKL